MIRDNTIADNEAVVSGGGLCGCGGTIRNNIIASNSAGLHGGGLYLCNGTVLRNTISDNEAGDNGGGLSQCAGTIESNMISGNSAGDPDGHGGGLELCSGIVRGNTIRGNSAGYGGGLSGCGGTIQTNIVSDNTAATQEGGAGLFDCDGMIRNNTITHNSMLGPGGIGGLYGCSGAIRNCIIWGNTGTLGLQLFDCSPRMYCCIQGGSGGTGNIADDPQFADPDGPDDDPATYEDNNYRLSADSPCIDRGDNSLMVSPWFDIDGNLRIAFGKDSLRVDMGAHEFGSPPFQVREIAPHDAGLRVFWNSQPNDTYTVWSCPVLGMATWSEAQTLASQGATTSYTSGALPTAWRVMFYRIEMKPGP